jgi:hypothetical protein
MQTFTRVDGVQCEAMRFTGGGVDAADHLFEVLDILNKAELQAVWVEEKRLTSGSRTRKVMTMYK